MRYQHLLLATGALIGACTEPAPETVERSAHGLSNGLVISQVYGGGGNTGAPYNRDYVELFNRGAAPASTAGWAIQYGSGTANFSSGNIHTLAAATIPAGGAYLVALASGANGSALPTPDESGALALAASSGKIALLNTTTALTGCGASATPCSSASIVDLVGYGSASQAEGSPTAALSNTTAAVRRAGGCTETDSNSADFEVAAPAPRTSMATPAPCGAPVDAGPAPDATEVVDAGAADAAPGADAEPAADASEGADAGEVDASGAADGGVVLGDGGPFTAVLNEIKVNPPGTDDGFEFLELRGSGTLPSHTYLMTIEGDSTSTVGRVNYVKDISGTSFGSNGLILVRAAGRYTPPAETTVIDDPQLMMGKIQNGTESIVLVTSPTPIDTVGNPDGGIVPRFPFAGATVIDAVGWKAMNQGTVFGGVDITFQFPADGTSRFLDDPTALSAEAWYAGGLMRGDPANVAWDPSLARTPNFPSDAVMLTPGAPNDGTRAAPPLDAGLRDASGPFDGSGGTRDASDQRRDALPAADALPEPDAEVFPDATPRRDSGRITDAGPPEEEGGCGCSTAPSGSSGERSSAVALLALAGIVLVSRRRRSSRSS